MKTRILLKDRSNPIITSFSIVDGKLAFTIGSGTLNVGETVIIRVGTVTYQLYIDSIIDGVYISTTPWTQLLPSTATVVNVLIDGPVIDEEVATATSLIFRTIQQPDGKLIVAGYFSSFNAADGPVAAGRIIRLNVDGTHDTTFNTGTGFDGAGLSWVDTVVLQEDNKILVGGTFDTYNGATASGIARLNADGSLDGTFNTGTGFIDDGTPTGEKVNSIAIQSNGKILVVGDFIEYNGVTHNRIIRLNIDGSHDATFDAGSGFDSVVSKVLIHSSNEIVVVGQFSSYDGATHNRIIALQGNGDPSITMTFGTGVSGASAVIDDILEFNTKLIFVGSFTLFDGNVRRGIVKTNADGSEDTSFNSGNGFNFNAYAVKILSNNKIVVGGLFSEYDGTTVNQLVRLNQDGTIDGTYDVTAGNPSSAVFDLYVLNDGNLLVSGYLYNQTPPFSELVILNQKYKSVFNDFKELDLREDLQFPLNYNIADISKPQNRKSNFSKTITLPGTKNNSQIFTQLFEIDADNVYNVNEKKSVVVLQDNLEIFNGVLRLNNIKRDDWNTVSYDVSLDGEIATLFSSLKNSEGTDLMLSDLDMSEWEHSLNRDNVLNSWVGDIIKNGVAYSNITVSTPLNIIDTEFAPTARTIFRIGTFNDLNVGDVVRFQMDNPGTVNFDQSSGHHTIKAFFDSDNIQVPAGQGDPMVNLAFRVGPANSGELTKITSLGEGYVYPTIYTGLTDGGGLPQTTDISTTRFRPYIFVHEYIRKIFKQVGFTYESQFMNSDFFNRLIMESYTNFGSNSEVFGESNISNAVGNRVVDFNEIILDPSGQWNISSGAEHFANGTTARRPNIRFVTNFNASAYLAVAAGWEISLRVWRSLNANGTPNTQFDSGSSLLGWGNPNDDNGNVMRYDIARRTSALTGVTIGQGLSAFPNGIYDFTIDWLTLRPGERIRFSIETSRSEVVTLSNTSVSITGGIIEQSRDMSARDLLTSLINMFNLYIESDRFNPKKVYIEPVDSYFQSDFVDWTDKVDVSRTIEIEPVSTKSPKNYRYTYDDDSDFLNKDYKEVYDETYGEFEITTSNQFNDNTVETKVKFAPTVISDELGDGRVIIPAIYKDINRNILDQHKPRILYWKGLTYVPGGFEVDSIDTSDKFGTSCLGYAGHLDSPLDATLDLNWGLLQKAYFGTSYPVLVTENTLYFRYHRKAIEEITSPESRLVKMYLKLNSYDIATLSFRRGYWIKGVSYKLQKINDYNPLNNDPVLCEFLKAKPVQPIERPFELICDEISNGFTVGNGALGNTMEIVTTGDTISYINILGQIEVLDDPSSIDMDNYPIGNLCFYGSTSLGTPYPPSSFGGEITSFIFYGLLTSLSFVDSSELITFGIDGSATFNTLDLSSANLSDFFIWYDGSEPSTLETIDISGSTDLPYLEIYCNNASLTDIITPGPDSFTQLSYVIISESSMSDSQIDNLINSIDDSISGGYLQIDGASTGNPTVASLTKRNALIANSWTLVFN